MRRTVLAACGVLTVLGGQAAGGAGPAAGQDTKPGAAAPEERSGSATVPPEILIALDADTLAERDAAQRRLLESDATLADIERVLERPGLSPEVTERLRAAAFERFSTAPRGGMGVQFTPSVNDNGMEISRVVGGFPAADVLEDDDIIVTTDGVPVRGDRDFQLRIISRLPGETIPAVIRRDGREFEVAIPIGRYDQLGNARSLSDELVREAYRFRQSVVRGQPEPRVQEIEMPGGGWTTIDPRAWGVMDMNRDLVMGGQARLETTRWVWQKRVRRDGGGGEVRNPRTREFADMTLEQLYRRQVSLGNLRRTIEQQIDSTAEALSLPDLEDRFRGVMEQRLADARIELAEATRRLEALRDVLKQKGGDPASNPFNREGGGGDR